MSNTKTIIAFDPGKVTGIATGEFSDTEPLVITGATIVPYDVLVEGFEIMSENDYDYVVSEVFEVREGQSFKPNLLGVRVEGMLDLINDRNVVWRSPALKSQVPDKILQDSGEWRTGRDVDWEDGRDANDAIIHLIGFVAFELRHVPTLRKYFKPKFEQRRS